VARRSVDGDARRSGAGDRFTPDTIPQRQLGATDVFFFLASAGTTAGMRHAERMGFMVQLLMP